MKNQSFKILFSILLTSFLFTACEEDEDGSWRNNPPKVAFAVVEESVQPLDLNEVETAPVDVKGTVQSDAGLAEVTIEVLRASGNVEVLNELTFDEVTGKIYTFTVPLDFNADLQGIKVTGVDVQDRIVEKTLDITVIEKRPELVFSPLNGFPGSNVTLSGFYFEEENIESVMIGTLDVGTFTVAEDGSTVTFTIPEGAESGPVSVYLLEGEPMVSKTDFIVLDKPKEVYTFEDIISNAQGNRNDDGVVTAISAIDGKTYTLAEGLDENVSKTIDFITADSGGDDKLDLFSPAGNSWLTGNYFKKDESGDMMWPVLNETKMRILEAGEIDFATATKEEIEAIDLGDFKLRLETLEVGGVAVFVTGDGLKGLILYKASDNAPGKVDQFTFDIKVLK